MKKIFFLSIIAVFFTSCISTKDITYFQPSSASKSDSIRVVQENSKPYRIQASDILSINIKALDQRLVEMFSASSQGATQMQVSPQSLFFNGYTVDDHGNIRVPILGEVNVLGFTADEIRQKIEKQLRMPVVVLRHRPSILPIISAYTMGKEAAEQKAASTLPRQGKNNSTLSSLLRFAYYYTDYVLGQFYIQVKYVLRGKVVVYDRYYFDFINDSKRSNISLPNWFTKSIHLLETFI